MAITTWSNMRARIARSFGYLSVQTTTGHTTADNITSSALIPYFPTADMLNGWYVAIHDSASTDNDGEVRRITDYTAAGVMTVSDPDLTADNNARTIAVYRYFHPDEYLNAFNDIRKDAFPLLHISRDLETLVSGLAGAQSFYTVPSTIRQIDAIYIGQRLHAENFAENLLANSSFEDWTSGAPDNWTLSGAGSTVAQEQSTTGGPSNYMVLTEGSSAKVTAALNIATTFLQTITPSVATEGVEVNVGIWVYCLTPSRVSAQVSGTNVVNTPVNGSTHTGTGWEMLKVSSAALNSAATSFDVGIAITSGAAIACYVDDGICVLGQSEHAEGLWTPAPRYRFRPVVDSGTSGGQIEFTSAIPPKHRIRILGRDILSSVSADTDTFEVDNEAEEVLADMVRARLAQQRADLALDEREEIRWLRRASAFRSRAERAFNNGVGLGNNARVLAGIPDA